MKKKDNVIPLLLESFQAESELLSKVIKQTKIHDNKPNVGSVREQHLLKFLERHIPTGCSITKGGFLYDLKGNRSNQIDLIITNEQTLQFKNVDDYTESYNCVEGSLVAISVKTKLTKSELFDSIENLCSISTEKNVRMDPRVTNVDQVKVQIPQKVIFAYTGNSFENIISHLDSYIKEKSIPIEQRPDLIIVNDSYFISKVPPGGANEIMSGEPLTPGQYLANSQKDLKHIGGLALLDLLTRIQNMVVVSKFYDVDYQIYKNEISKIAKR